MKTKFIIGFILVVLGIIGITLILSSEHALIFHPKGIVARDVLELILINFGLMFAIIIPTYILLFVVFYKYCIKRDHTKYDPEHTYGITGQIVMWLLPTIIVLILSVVTWNRTHQLNPYKPLESPVEPLKIQVVAIDWKWLFIYPELGIATLNYFHIPEQTPIHLNLTADNSPMNSFWVPQLSGQIYAMTGMTTQLFLMADGVGEYAGKAVEINGEGYADMTFPAISSSKEDFDKWVTEVKKSPHHLTEEYYNEVLLKPEINKSIIHYSEVAPDLYNNIVHKFMYPPIRVL